MENATNAAKTETKPVEEQKTGKVLTLPVKAGTAKAKEAKKPSQKVRRGGSSDAKITVLVKENPHRKGSKDHKKYVKLTALKTRTVAAAVEAEIDRGYLNYLAQREVITIG